VRTRSAVAPDAPGPSALGNTQGALACGVSQPHSNLSEMRADLSETIASSALAELGHAGPESGSSGCLQAQLRRSGAPSHSCELPLPLLRLLTLSPLPIGSAGAGGL
jgi:hypothetical protein